MSKKVGVRVFQLVDSGDVNMPPENVLSVRNSDRLEVKFSGYPPVDSTDGVGALEVSGCGRQSVCSFEDIGQNEVRTCQRALL